MKGELMSNINRSDPTTYSDSTDIDDLSISSDAGNTAAPLNTAEVQQQILTLTIQI